MRARCTAQPRARNAPGRHGVAGQPRAGFPPTGRGTSRRLATARLPEAVKGIAMLHSLVGRHSGAELQPGFVVETQPDRSLWVQVLVAVGYQVYAVDHK